MDGVPLAIELAAARCALLSADEIARRLDAAFTALGSIFVTTHDAVVVGSVDTTAWPTVWPNWSELSTATQSVAEAHGVFPDRLPVLDRIPIRDRSATRARC